MDAAIGAAVDKGNEMALYENGKKIDAERVCEIMQGRFVKQPKYPFLSDLLGDDWAKAGMYSDEYLETAKARATVIYGELPYDPFFVAA